MGRPGLINKDTPLHFGALDLWPRPGLSSSAQLLKKASRSALMVSACVVGIPCGKPL